MDKFTTLEPVRLYASNASTPADHLRGSGKGKGPLLPTSRGPAPFARIGRLPVDLHIAIIIHLAIPDLPAYALASRALSRLTRDERVWEARWAALGIDAHGLDGALDALEDRIKAKKGLAQGQAPPIIAVDIADDDFGEFTAGDSRADELGDFVGAFSGTTIHSPVPTSSFQPQTKPTYLSLYIRVHTLLKPLIPALSAPPHAVLTVLFPAPAPPLRQQAHTLRLLALFLSPRVKPLRAWRGLSAALRAAIDRFEDGLLTAFDVADGRADEAAMREVAEASWEVWDRSEGEWELGTVWAEKREIFYEQSKWKPLDNFLKDGQLDFDAMDAFIAVVIAALKEHGSRAVRVFPPQTRVLLSFAERLAVEVVGEYIAPLLTRARELAVETFLKAAAASFREAWHMVDIIFEIAQERSDAAVSRVQAEDVVYRMFEVNMDEYLDEEVEFVKQCFETTCRAWESQLSKHAIPGVVPNLVALQAQRDGQVQPQQQVRFLGSSNPAQVKRTVLASFTDVLRLPVTIVPRAVGAAITTGSSAAVQGIAMLNPQRWGAVGAGSRLSTWGGGGGGAGEMSNYTQDFERSGEALFELGDAEDEEPDGSAHDEAGEDTRKTDAGKRDGDSEKATRSSIVSTATTATAASTESGSTSMHQASTDSSSTAAFDKLDLLLSLDVALELIHADRESLKRAETFAGYPGQYGHRVRDTIEEIFVLLLQALGDRHIRPGFSTATEQMKAYKPAEHEETRSVAPLMQFFELVHIGDTIQSMVQVYFDKELAPHIDRTDFLNTVVREKKRFEDVLDDCVAAGLNAGTDALMNQVEHIIIKSTKPREYYPSEDTPLELGPTQACTEAISCLRMHCQLLKGSTSKEVLEVFYQEIGIRLIAILQKHLKRQIISLNGGFQVIADLNAYYTFISSLKVSSIVAEFSYLKMLGHVYVVEDAKDLAQIVRDVTRYGGAYKPEDVYEFIQRRADWKKIEKTVDKTMYNLSFKEDCVIL